MRAEGYVFCMIDEVHAGTVTLGGDPEVVNRAGLSNGLLLAASW